MILTSTGMLRTGASGASTPIWPKRVFFEDLPHHVLINKRNETGAEGN